MLRPLAFALLGASILTRISPSVVQAEERSAPAPAPAVAKGEPSSARRTVEALESQLIEADDSTRPDLLKRLREAYTAAASESESAGRAEEAESYRINAAILTERLGAVRENPKPEPPESPPPALPDPEGALTTAPGPASDEKADVSRPAPVVPKIQGASLPASPPPSSTELESPSTEPDRGTLSRQADELYRDKRYSQAGAIYTRLASANQLPENRRNAWAYCRRFEVVKRINAEPRSEGEWAAIAAEITAIRQLSPSVWWFDVYLQDLVKSRSSQVARVAPKSNQIVLRGAQPEESPFSPPPPSAPRTLTVPAPMPVPMPKRVAPDPGPTAPSERPSPDPETVEASAPVPSVPSRDLASLDRLPLNATGTLTDVPQDPPSKPESRSPFQNPDLSRWQVENSPNFRIYHADPDLARRVARIAESTREEQIRRWTGQPPRGTWSPICEIYLYPNAKIFSQRTDQPEDSPGFSTSGLMAGRVTARRINLRADHEKLEQAILPHEVTHIVMAELFAGAEIPRWADEGMAVLAEPQDEQRIRAQDLTKPLAGGRIFAVDQLLVMDYPDGQYWPLYYAQSISLTRFLVESSSPVRFLEFVRDAQSHGYDAALRRHYQMDGLSDLQARWETYARSAVEVRTASSQPESPNRE